MIAGLWNPRSQGRRADIMPILSSRRQPCWRASLRIILLSTAIERTAIAVTAAFLRVNGYKLNLEDQEAYEFLIALYDTGEFRFERLEPWLREHTSKV